MEDKTLSDDPPHAEIRTEVQRLFVAVTAAHRQTRDDLQLSRQAAERLALASVEALELLEDTIAGLAEELDSKVRQALEAARVGAHQRLAEADIELDGTVGERIDPTKHRVIESKAPPGRLPNVVSAIWRPGVRVRGKRVRPAEVVAEYTEGSHGKNRD